MRSTLLSVTLLLAATALQAQCPITDTLYFSDLEADDGGMIEGGYGNWEWGAVPTTLTGGNCDNASAPNPPGPFSGLNGWGTDLDGCYDNAGDTSTISFNVDLSDPLAIDASLSWQQWYEIFTTFDYIWVSANGVHIYDNNTNQITPAYEAQSASLFPFLGQTSVDITFHLFATTVVNRVGWYIDDVMVTACIDPNVGMQDLHAPVLGVWPSPTNDLLYVSLRNASTVRQLVLFSALGQEAARWNWNPGSDGKTSLDVSGLAAGTYLLRAEGAEVPTVVRVVID